MGGASGERGIEVEGWVCGVVLCWRCVCRCSRWRLGVGHRGRLGCVVSFEDVVAIAGLLRFKKLKLGSPVVGRMRGLEFNFGYGIRVRQALHKRCTVSIVGLDYS